MLVESRKDIVLKRDLSIILNAAKMRTGRHVLHSVVWESLVNCFRGKWRQKLDGKVLRSEWEVRNGNNFSKKRKETWS